MRHADVLETGISVGVVVEEALRRSFVCAMEFRWGFCDQRVGVLLFWFGRRIGILLGEMEVALKFLEGAFFGNDNKEGSLLVFEDCGYDLLISYLMTIRSLHPSPEKCKPIPRNNVPQTNRLNATFCSPANDWSLKLLPEIPVRRKADRVFDRKKRQRI